MTLVGELWTENGKHRLAVEVGEDPWELVLTLLPRSRGKPVVWRFTRYSASILAGLLNLAVEGQCESASAKSANCGSL